MNWNWKLMASLLAAAVFVLPGSAIAGGGGPPNNEIDQELDDLDIDVDVDDMVQNDADIFVGDRNNEHANAVANCQWLLAVNTIIHTNVEVDMLGVVSDDDVSEYPWWFDLIGARQHIGDVTRTEQVTRVADGNATCEQDVGHVTVHLANFDGWGEPAPMGGALSAAGITPSILPGRGPPDRNDLDQEADIDIEVDVDDLVQNDVFIDVEGDANSVANCQLLIAWNTFIVNDVRFNAEGRISDDDSDSVVMPPTHGGGGPPELMPLVHNDTGGDRTVTETFEASRTSSAHCTQTVKSITLSTGDEVVRVPPES